MSGNNFILALDQAARILLRRDVTESRITRQAAEQRDPLTNEHWDSGDGETLNQAGAQKPLNGDSSVDVDVLDATGRELRNYFCRRPRHLFDDTAAHG